LRADAAPSWVWVPELAEPGGRTPLSEDESHYLERVCRARVGDHVSATDGRGNVAELAIVTLGRGAMVEVLRRERVARPRVASIWVGSPEGDRGDWLVEKLAELGVAVFQPVDTERAGWPVTGNRLERWRRLAVAAMRQSRRAYLLEVREPVSMAAAIEGLVPGSSRFVADATGEPAARIAGGEQPVTVAMVGPSPGLSEGEQRALADSGFRSMCLSDSRLRTETAALAWAAWWAAATASS
jgi:16S rRNA (uracil1498-N3)-methyltransferase